MVVKFTNKPVSIQPYDNILKDARKMVRAFEKKHKVRWFKDVVVRPVKKNILNISNCELINNKLPYSACIYAYNPELMLSNNIIEYNIANGLGGCIFINASDLKRFFTNECTISITK